MLPLGSEDIAFCAGASGFEDGRNRERCILYIVVRGADTFAAGAEVQVAAVRCPAWGDGAAHSLDLATAGVG